MCFFLSRVGKPFDSPEPVVHPTNACSLTNEAPFKSGINRLYNILMFIAKKHCYNDIIHQPQNASLFLGAHTKTFVDATFS